MNLSSGPILLLQGREIKPSIWALGHLGAPHSSERNAQPPGSPGQWRVYTGSTREAMEGGPRHKQRTPVQCPALIVSTHAECGETARTKGNAAHGLSSWEVGVLGTPPGQEQLSCTCCCWLLEQCSGEGFSELSGAWGGDSPGDKDC